MVDTNAIIPMAWPSKPVPSAPNLVPPPLVPPAAGGSPPPPVVGSLMMAVQPGFTYTPPPPFGYSNSKAAYGAGLPGGTNVTVVPGWNGPTVTAALAVLGCLAIVTPGPGGPIQEGDSPPGNRM